MAQGGPKPTTFYVERMAATRSPSTPAAPSGLDNLHAAGQTDPGPGTTTAGDGLYATGLMAITVSVWPQSGFTLTGGNLLCWCWFPWLGWARMPGSDLAITAGTYTGPVGHAFAPLRIPNRMGVIINYLTSSLTGTSPDFLVRLDGFTSVLGMSTS